MVHYETGLDICLKVDPKSVVSKQKHIDCIENWP